VVMLEISLNVSCKPIILQAFDRLTALNLYAARPLILSFNKARHRRAHHPEVHERLRLSS
jgi:hypothetical protein